MLNRRYKMFVIKFMMQHKSKQSFSTILCFLVVTTVGWEKKIKNQQLQLEARIPGATIGIM